MYLSTLLAKAMYDDVILAITKRRNRIDVKHFIRSYIWNSPKALEWYKNHHCLPWGTLVCEATFCICQWYFNEENFTKKPNRKTYGNAKSDWLLENPCLNVKENYEADRLRVERLYKMHKGTC